MRRRDALICVLILTACAAARAEGPPPGRDASGDPLPPGAVARLGTLRYRVGKQIQHLAYSPDGNRLAVRNYDGGVSIWDAATGQKVRELPDNSQVGPLAWRPDGRGVLLVLPKDGEPYVADFTDENVRLPPPVPRTPLKKVAANPNVP